MVNGFFVSQLRHQSRIVVKSIFAATALPKKLLTLSQTLAKTFRLLAL